AERINNTMKNELLKGMVFHHIEEVKTAVTVAVEFYNHERPHMSIDMMTPVEAAACTGEIDKRWTSYRLIAIKNRMDGLEIAEKGLPLPALSGVDWRA
ncbi:MAG: integrase core domain-containing protein, partial [Bacteroidales bacterium]|nr:integrase core domain-containing protein [Bacteroidales bacterium]